jgi:hypothetical protein
MTVSGRVGEFGQKLLWRGEGPTFEMCPPHQLGRQYDVARDERFLINMELDSAAAPITLLQKWHPKAKK